MSLPPAIPRPISRPCLKMSIGLLLPNNCDRSLGLLPEENESLADGSCCRLPKPPLPWDDCEPCAPLAPSPAPICWEICSSAARNFEVSPLSRKLSLPPPSSSSLLQDPES